MMKRVLQLAVLALVVLALFAVAQPGPSLAGGEERVMVEFAPGRGASVRAALQRAGGNIHYQFDNLNVFAVTVPEAAIQGLERNPNVVTIEADVLRYPMAETTPWGVTAVQAPTVWSEGAIGSDITVCIIDSGYYVDHEDLRSTNVDGEGAWNTDRCGHGTHVTGTIAAVHNDLGVAGVSPDVSLFIVKVFDGPRCRWTYSSDLIAATQVCAGESVDIISMSLGGPSDSPWEDSQFEALYSEQGILSIAAAGNAGNTAYHFPASYDSVVSVAAVAEGNAIADFSQQNNQVELAAPGVGVLSTVPGGYEAWSGTSMATPHVSAVAALLWSANPTSTNAEIRDAMAQTALDLGTTGRDNAYGHGLVQASDAYDYLGGGPVDSPPTVVLTAPADGATVVGTVIVSADATDYDAVTQVEFFVDGSSIGVDEDSLDGWSVIWDTTTSTNGSVVLSATATDTVGKTATDSIEVTVDNDLPPADLQIYVVGFTLTGKAAGPNKSATAVVTIGGDDGSLVSDATVTGTWSGSYNATVSGLTAADGTVIFRTPKVRATGATFTFTVDDIAKEGTVYNAELNVPELSDTVTP